MKNFNIKVMIKKLNIIMIFLILNKRIYKYWGLCKQNIFGNK